MTSTRTATLRARDIDRAASAGQLDAAYADGQLDYDEYRRRVDCARAATTVGELDALNVDLQTIEPLPEVRPLGHRRSRKPLAIVAVAVVIAAGAVVGARELAGERGRIGTSELRQADVVPIVATPFSFDTAAGLANFRTQYLARFGDPNVLAVYMDVTDDTALVERVTPDGRGQRIEVNAGFDVSGDTVSTAGRPIVDWNTLDTDALARRISEAPTQLGRPSAAVDTVNMSFDAASGRPVVRIDVRENNNGVGAVVVDLSGAVISVQPR
ncbi:DUF1707 SHOCT-like domain-containing protein [Actinomycetes bacterium M1A6_2h]